MPLGDFEKEVLRAIAANRNPDSYLADATVLHQSPSSPRASRDVDIFHDTTASLSQSVERDVVTLKTAGFQVELGKSQGTFQRVHLRRDGRSTKIEWIFDSAFRFFSIEPDAELRQRGLSLRVVVKEIPSVFGSFF